MGGAITMRFGIDFAEKVQGLLLLPTSSRVGPAATDHWIAQADQTEADGRPRLAPRNARSRKYHMDEEIKAFDVPALIIVGDADETTPHGGSVIMSRCIPGLRARDLPGHRPFTAERRAEGGGTRARLAAAVPEVKPFGPRALRWP